MIWSDVQYRCIYVANINGSNLTPVIYTNITTPGAALHVRSTV